jgi:hypothetical protein
MLRKAGDLRRLCLKLSQLLWQGASRCGGEQE